MLNHLRKFDWVLFGSAFCLTALGLAVLYSTSLSPEGGAGGNFSNFNKQAAFAGVGVVVALVASGINFRAYSSYARLLYGLSAALLAAVLVFGQVVNGTRGWFGIAGFGIQPVEIVKFFLIVFWARYFSKYSREQAGIKTLIGSGVALAAIVALVIGQPDFGSALLLMAVWGSMLLIAGVRRSHLAVIICLGIATLVLSWSAVLKPYQKDRILVFLDPSRDPYGRGYQVTQSMIAIGSGGFAGKGLGAGTQSQLRFLPERQTDFLFASLAEELGFVGVLAVLTLFGTIMYRGYLLAASARDDFAAFLVLGILISFAVEVVVNIGGNLGLLPITGIALPFLSYGGSALLTKFLMIGVLEAAAVRR